jgi:hypothetical protein
MGGWEATSYFAGSPTPKLLSDKCEYFLYSVLLEIIWAKQIRLAYPKMKLKDHLLPFPRTD